MADLLQEEHQDGDEGGSLLLQSEERPRRSDKQLGEAVRHVVLETVLGDDGLHRLPVRIHQVVRPGVLTRHLIPADSHMPQQECKGETGAFFTLLGDVFFSQ